jgi:predicted  nucleic acid-binding Zn-ribbon protein
MEATAAQSRRVLESPEEAKSPQRILVRSLLKSRNKLRAKYREVRSECKRWRNQAAAVEKSRSAWRQRALAGEMALQHDQAERAALQAQVQELRESSVGREAASDSLHPLPADPRGTEKKGR